MTAKRNRFFTFIFSFLPGAAEMYMGFMKNGLSIMAAFFVSIIIPSLLHLGDIFILFPVLIWFYSFFHAIGLKNLPDDRFAETRDNYVWYEFMPEEEAVKLVKASTVRKVFAWTLIVFGTVTLLNNLGSVAMTFVWNYFSQEDIIMFEYIFSMAGKVIASIAVVVIGCVLVRGKKKTLDAVTDASTVENEIETVEENNEQNA